MKTLTIRRPCNLHVHFRRGPMLEMVLPFTARVYGAALAMPNTGPPVCTGDQVTAYRDEILRAAEAAGCGDFRALMTFKLTPDTTPGTIRDCACAGAIAAKLYPDGMTTNSHGGIPAELFGGAWMDGALAALADNNLVLCVHAEYPGCPWWSAEREFIATLGRWLDVAPDLRIVVEHVSSVEMARFVATGPETLAATVTPQHLIHTSDDVLCHIDADGRRGVDVHSACYPMPKFDGDRDAIRQLATSGHHRVFAGDDSAPHRIHDKNYCGCPGVFCAPASLPTYAEVFEVQDRLDRLEAFAGRNGPAFYGIEPRAGTVTLAERPWTVPKCTIRQFAPAPGQNATVTRNWRAGETIRWTVDSVQ